MTAHSAAGPPSRGRRHFITALKVCAFAGALVFVASRVDWMDSVRLASGEVLQGRIENGFAPQTERVIIQLDDGGGRREIAAGDWERGSRRCGLRAALAALEILPLVGGLLVVAAMYLVHALRWWLLLGTAGLRGGVLAAIRLTCVGYFSNNFMPGNAGGDVIKAVGIARLNQGRRVRAVASVLVDRVVGLLGFAVMAAFAAACGHGTIPRLAHPGWGLGALGGMMLAGLLVFWPPSAARLGLLGRKLLGRRASERFGDWIGPYLRRPGRAVAGLGLALAAHACTVTAFVLFGRDLGIEAPVMVFAFAVPVTLVAAAVPVSPGGWGIREVSLLALFPTSGVWAAQPSSVVLLSVLWGAANLVVSLIGGLALLGGGQEARAWEAARSESVTV